MEKNSEVIKSNLRWKELLNPHVLSEMPKIKPFTEADPHETALWVFIPKNAKYPPRAEERMLWYPPRAR